jgi:PST family polysaccharide transporter
MYKYIVKEINRFITTESKKILKNIGWLFFDRVFRMGMALVVGAWVARYLGPEQYGSLNYLLATVGLLASFAGLGLDGMIVKEMVEHPHKASNIMSTVFSMRLISGAISFLICVAIFFYLKHDDMHVFYIGIILAVTLIANAMGTISFYYQAQVNSKTSVLTQSIAYILISICKVIFLLLEGSLLVFAVITTMEVIVAGLFMLIVYRKVSKQVLHLKIDKALAMKLLSQSWPLIFAGFMIMIYMRIDQIMLGELIGDFEVGTYTAALKLSEIWYFIPGIISASLFPSIIEAKKQSDQLYIRRGQKLFDMLVLLSVALALFVTFTSDIIIYIIYGDEYKDAALILAIHIWTAVFVFFSTASSNFYMIENLQVKTFTRAVMSAVLNILLNFILIPMYAAVGAAVATLISQFFSGYLFDLFSSKTRILFRMKTRSLLAINLINYITARLK